MFTGIITDMGYILDMGETEDHNQYISIATHYEADSIDMGASIACAGVCLTVINKGYLEDGTSWFTVDISPETLKITTLQYWKPGIMMNLERALRVGDELGGHMVLGHADGVARIVDVQEENESHHVIISPNNKDLMRYIAYKGSITVDGVSLTVNKVEDNKAYLTIIPHTWFNTTFQYIRPKIVVNVEVDMLARYVLNEKVEH